ncbi:MAG: pyridoxine/pyridoxamine 5'-phosphate oxidase [Acidimicrobiia bacterium]
MAGGDDEVGDPGSGGGQGADIPGDSDPVARLTAWLDEARSGGTAWTQVMVLATTTAGRPSARAVALRHMSDGGLVFFSDENSRKGLELAANSAAAAVFLLPSQRRQARVEGRVEQLGDERADEFFSRRDRSAQLAVWGWRQGEVLKERGELSRGLDQARRHFAGRPIPRPRYWRGYVLDPEVVELWEEQPNGFHERDRFVLRPDGSWRLELLAP